MDRSTKIPDRTLDYHAHILPGCDHGSDGLQTSLRQIALAKAAGIQTICATSHFYPHQESAASFLRRREACWSLLREQLSADDPVVELGAEVLICDGMERMDELSSLCRQGTNELLLELPFYTWQRSVWETIFALHEDASLRIVIAHGDRYPANDIERLIQEGIPIQLNAGCFRHPLKRKRYLAWIASGAVSYLGSDIHGTEVGYREWDMCRKFLDKKFQPERDEQE